MPRTIAYKCKTPGCEAWFPMRDVPDDTARMSVVVLYLGDPVKITCPDCKQEHEYLATDKKLVQFEANKDTLGAPPSP